MNHALSKRIAAAAILAGVFALTPPAQSQMDNESDITLGGLVQPKGTDKTTAGEYKKNGPYKIAFALPGVGNSWIVQTIQEGKAEAGRYKQISSYIQTDSEWQPAKQVADLEDLLTKNVDAVILGTVTPSNVNAELDKFADRHIPVVISGTGTTGKFAVEVRGGGEYFGKVGGQYLVQQLHGKGTIWAFRGVAGVQEEVDRYNGFVSALKGTDVKIGAEVYGDWGYAKAKQECTDLVLSGKPVDGIWFSGAEMTRACIDVFQQYKKPLVPMTGEANNGFFRAWKASGVSSVAAVFPPGLSTAAVRATLALLEGKSIYRHYWSEPAPITTATLDKFYRPDLNDNFWAPSSMPADKIKELYAAK
jgi:ribose transport system substrate-binding protein